MMRLPDGFHDLDEATYHDAHGVGAPALSASLASILLRESPWHAWHARTAPPEESETFDLGRAAHALILEGEERFEIVDAPDWRTKAAREARDAARQDGRFPLLAHRADQVREMASAVRAQLDRFEDPPIPLSNGTPERTLVWSEGEVTCKARLDWLHADRLTIDDLKTCESAEPGGWGRRQLYAHGADIQAAFYVRGVHLTTHAEPRFRFVLAETRPPYAVSVVALDPQAMALAHQKVETALAIWRKCLASGKWPGYPTQTCYVSAPPWELAQGEAMALAEEEATDER